ncbi:TonB-dependent receptor [Synoicihabitans lomoniglobus]|uniref:TonB-dependent receptor n=1 Tax=Synoicihabitans lomoniglobus TaxID=2909285 RepID=A0AAF0CMR8_9BACT|nr:TonB-dependent receptor [Opitutaceae bacterium LMO-M01]WED63440.1 TonB-dependent receptor [Opitutaceae bacterium LMO-M01]
MPKIAHFFARSVPLLFPAALWAQTTAPQDGVIELEAVEVTSQFRVQEIQDVPIPVTAYSGAALEALGIRQYKDLAPFVPGFMVQEQSPNNPGINIRGVTTDSGDPRSETRVSLFQDGVSISRSRGSVVELFDMERVEVLKGPQGTLFGRGAEIGAVSLIQNKAQNATQMRLTAGTGSFGSTLFEGMFNAPIIEDTFFGRVAFTAAQRDGTIDNVADGSTLNGKETSALRASFRWQPTGDTTVDFIFNYQNDNPPGTSFKSGTIAPPGGDTSPYTFAALNRGRDLYIDRSVWGGTLLFNTKLTDTWSLSSITGYREFDSFEQFDADGSFVDLLEFAEDATGDQFSQEFRFNFDNGGPFIGFVGAGLFREQGTQRVPFYGNEQQIWPFLSGSFRDGIIAAGVPAALAEFAIPAVNPFVPVTAYPASMAAFANPALPPSLQGLAFLAGVPLKGSHVEEYSARGETTAYDVFVDGTYRVTDRFELTGGFRFTAEDITSGYEAHRVSATPATVGFILGAGENIAFTPTNGVREETNDSTGWVGRLNARYELNDTTSTYASVSRGRRPEAVTISATGPATYLKEEVVWNYEIGVKGVSANRRLNWSAAAFTYDYANFQTTIADPAQPGRFITTDAGNATGIGAELAVQGALTESVSVFASYGYTDATFDDTGDNGRPQEFAGYSFRLTAENTFALGLTWTLPVDGIGQFWFTPVYQYKSEHFFDDNNGNFNFALREDGYSLVNLRAGWRSVNGRWELTGWIENIADEDYLIDAGNTGGSFGIPTFIAGSPRLWGVSATFNY